MGRRSMKACLGAAARAANWMICDIDRIGNIRERRDRRFTRLLLGSALTLCAVPAAAETLADAVEAAYGNNPTLVEQRYRQKSSNENYVQARAQYGPSLSVSATGTYDYSKLHSRESDGNEGLLSLSLRQPVYTGGRQRGALAQARANVLGSEEALRRVEGEVVQNVIAVYAAMLRDQRRLEVARENVLVLRDQLTERRAKRRVRDVTITDVAQSDARLAAGESQLASAEAQLAVSRGEYLRIVGHEPGDLQPLPELPGLPASIDEAFAAADEGNANLAAARYSEEAARANIATQRGNQRPTATISAEAGKRGQLSPFDRHDYRTEVTAQLTITQPLWQGGAIRSRIRQAQDLSGAAQAGVDAERRQALQDVVLAWNQLASTRVAVVSGTRQVEAAQIAFAGMQREERYGLRSTIEVLNAEQELSSAQQTLLSSRYQEYIARSALLLAMGKLDARTVNSAIPAKDPEAEFRKVRWRGMLPTDPASMLLDRIGSASPYARPKPDLRGQNQPKPTGSPALPPTPDKSYTEAPLVPITQSPLVPADRLNAEGHDYEAAPPRESSPQ